MKGTFVAIDLLRDTDDSFKVLEFNTALAFSPNNFNNYFELSNLQTYISESNFSEVHFVGAATSLDLYDEQDGYSGSNPYYNLDKWFYDTYSGSSVDYTSHRVRLDQSNVPFIADASDKFILRNAYDSSALIDSTYSSNNQNFLTLLKASSSADMFPKTYFSGSDGFDTIGSSIRDNGNRPNFIIKKIGGQTEYQEFPKLYKVSGSAQLTALKGYLQDGEYLQEYVFDENNLVGDKTITYRAVGIIDSSLNFINCGAKPYYHSNALDIGTDVDWAYNSDGIGELPGWERPKFVQKHRRTVNVISENVAPGKKVIKSDGTLALGIEQQSGSVLIGVDIPNLSTDNSVNLFAYSGSLNEFSGSTTIVNPGVVVNKPNFIDSTFVVEIETTEGKKATLSGLGTVLIEDTTDNLTKFVHAKDLSSDDHNIIEVNHSNGTSRAIGLSSVKFFWDNNASVELDVEDADVFMIPYDSEDSNIGLVIHNIGTCTCFVCTTNTVYDTGDCLNSTCTSYYQGCITGSPASQYCTGYSFTTTGCSSDGKA